MSESIRSFLSESVFLGFALSLIMFQVGRFVQSKLKLAIFNPLVIATASIIAILSVCHIDYEVYRNGAKYLSFFMGPATICLAIPLYEQLTVLKKYDKAILIGIFSGVLTNALIVLALALVMHVDHTTYVTLLPKSITTAIGIELSDRMGGYVAITAAIIAVTGAVGNILAPVICRLAHIDDAVAKGVAIGTSSHALGTAKAIELGEVEGAISGLSIAVSGVLTVPMVMLFEHFV